MAEHNLFQGGLKTGQEYEDNLFPSVEFEDADRRNEPASHKDPVIFSLTRRLDFLGCKKVSGKLPNADEGPIWNFGERDFGSQALENYLRNNDVAVDDVLNVVSLPILTVLRYIRWEVCRPVPGLTFELRYRGAGKNATAAPVTIGTIDMGTEDHDVFFLPDPVYFKHNDMLQLVVTGEPDDGMEKLCEACLQLDPVVEAPCKGFY